MLSCWVELRGTVDSGDNSLWQVIIWSTVPHTKILITGALACSGIKVWAASPQLPWFVVNKANMACQSAALQCRPQGHRWSLHFLRWRAHEHTGVNTESQCQNETKFYNVEHLNSITQFFFSFSFFRTIWIWGMRTRMMKRYVPVFLLFAVLC